MTKRSSVRAAAVLASVPLVMLTASPAFAYSRNDGDQPGPGLSAVETLGIFVGLPLLLFGLIALLVYAPSLARGPRYRPGLSWWAEPVWFNGPVPATAGAETDVTDATLRGGGASARW